MYHPTLEEFKVLKNQGYLVPIYREVAAGSDTPVSALLKVKRGGYSFLLESVEGGEQAASYSFIGTEPYQVLSTREEDKTDPLHLIAKEMNRHKLAPASGLPDFCGGAVGYLAYETVLRLEELPSPTSDPLALPESVFMFIDTLLIFDHTTNKIKIVSHACPDGDADSIYQAAIEKIEELENRIKQPLEPHQNLTANTPAEPAEISSNLTERNLKPMLKRQGNI